MERIEKTVRFVNSFSFEGFYGTTTIYKFSDPENNIYIWKTSATLFYKKPVSTEADADIIEKKGMFKTVPVTKNAVIRIKASVKGVNDYKGEKQTELSRVSVLEILEKGKTPEQLKREKENAIEAKQQEQLSTLAENDQVIVMTYKRYKEHYADCETLYKSFEKRNGCSYISVIVRNGRMKASGVRGRGFNYYCFRWTENEKNYQTFYKAVSYENALKRFNADFPNAENVNK